jgi:hypothetical protein
MSKKPEEGQETCFTELIYELEREVMYHSGKNSSSYRKLTAQLSLDVALKAGSCSPFFELTSSKEVVSQLMPSLNLERVNDVAKMLSVIAKDLRMRTELSSEAKTYSREKRLRNQIKYKIKGITKGSKGTTIPLKET